MEVTREVRTPLLAYTGDTSPAGLDDYPPAFEAKVLITEMSFIRPNHRREKIHKFGHMHLDDFIERADRFKNELIICCALQHALSSAGGQARGRGEAAAAACASASVCGCNQFQVLRSEF